MAGLIVTLGNQFGCAADVRLDRWSSGPKRLGDCWHLLASKIRPRDVYLALFSFTYPNAASAKGEGGWRRQDVAGIDGDGSAQNASGYAETSLRLLNKL